MTSLLFKAVNSTVETVFQFTSEADLRKQLKVAVREGSILIQDQKDILGYLKTGHQHIAINHSTVFEVTTLDKSTPDPVLTGTSGKSRSSGRNRTKRRGS